MTSSSSSSTSWPERVRLGGAPGCNSLPPGLGVRVLPVLLSVLILGCQAGPPRSGGGRISGRAECRVERIDRLPEDDPQQDHLHVISRRWSIPALDSGDLRQTWTQGKGLELEATGPQPWLELVAPLAFDDPQYQDLVLEYSAQLQQPLTLRWTDTACSSYGERCSTGLVLQPAAGGRSRFVIGTMRSGLMRTMRLELEAGALVTIHSLRLAPAEMPSSGDAFELIGPSSGREPISANDARTSMVPGGGLEIVPAKHDGPLDIHLNLEAGARAEAYPRLRIETAGAGMERVEVFWGSEVCGEPRFHVGCRMEATPGNEPGVWEVQLSDHPRWRGMVDYLRVDLDSPRPRPFRLERLSLIPAEGGGLQRAAAGPGSGHRKTGGEVGKARRLDLGGAPAWRLDAGERLVVELPDHVRAPGLELDSISYRIPAAQAGVQLFELTGAWELVDGSRHPAFEVVGSFWRRQDSQWIDAPLERPEAPPRRLEIELVCGPNCSSFDEPGRFLEIAQPVYRYTPVTAYPPELNLIVLMIDTLRADHLSTYGYDRVTDPFIASLARRGAVYENVHAVDTWTNPAHAAFFTGRYPFYAGARHFQDVGMQGETLAEVLAEEGYLTMARTDSGQLRVGSGFGRGFDSYTATYEPLRVKLERTLADLDRVRERRQRFFSFIHTYMVHEPYSLTRDRVSELEMDGAWQSGLPIASSNLVRASQLVKGHPRGEGIAEYLSGQYDRGIRALDDELRWFFSELEARGALDDSVVVLTSDHGEEILEHGRLGHGAQLPFAELTKVPLIILDPNDSGGHRVEELMPQVRIADEILERLGLASRLGLADELPGVAVSFVTTRHCVSYPTTEYLSVVVRTDSCAVLEISERSTGQVVETRVLEGDDVACAASSELIQGSLATVKDQMELAGGYVDSAAGPREGANGSEDLPSADSAPGDDAQLDEHERNQLEALGYVTR